MKKLADYKTMEERIAYLLHVECLASDELWKLPLEEGNDLVREISELAKRYLNGDMDLTGVGNLIDALNKEAIVNLNESTGGQMFDLVKDSESHEEYPQLSQGKVVSIGERYRIGSDVVEISKSFDGCCRDCYYLGDKPSFCYENHKCRDVYFRKID